MSRLIQVIIFSIGIGIMGLGATSAAPITTDSVAGITTADSTVHKVGYWGYCKRLRYHCINKGALGEAGEGNCRRYREECGYRTERSRCDRLRDACRYKYERGEVGMGNCRRYHEECGGRSY